MDLFDSTGKVGGIPLADPVHGSVVGLTTLPNSDLVALERVFINRFTSLGFHLHRLSSESDFRVVKSYDFDPNESLINDNFEGITHVDGDHFFMVTDDNQNPLQRTLLIYFRLLE